jgi:hypothetical protein
VDQGTINPIEAKTLAVRNHWPITELGRQTRRRRNPRRSTRCPPQPFPHHLRKVELLPMIQVNATNASACRPTTRATKRWHEFHIYWSLTIQPELRSPTGMTDVFACQKEGQRRSESSKEGITCTIPSTCTISIPICEHATLTERIDTDRLSYPPTPAPGEVMRMLEALLCASFVSSVTK